MAKKLFARTQAPSGAENRYWQEIDLATGGLPSPPPTGAVILQAVDGALQWVIVPKLLAVNDGGK
jgi:hypothetical protein